MVMKSIEQFQKALKDPDVRAALGNVLHPQIVEDLPYILRVAKQHVNPGGAVEELVALIEDDEYDGLSEIKKIIEEGECDVNAVYDGKSLLHHAIYSENTQALEYLVEHPLIDMNSRGRQHCMPPLVYAAFEGETDAMTVLLRHEEIDVHAVDASGDFALSVQCANLEVDKILLADNRVDVNLFEPRPQQEWTTQETGPPICLAADCGNGMSLQTGGYENGVWECDVCEQFFSVNTPRYFCCAAHEHDICESCYRPGMIMPRKTRWIPFHHRMLNGNIDAVRVWLKHPDLDVNKHDIGGCPPLFYCFDKMNAHPDDLDNSMTILDMLLQDERTILSLRNRDGQSVKDVYKRIFSLYPEHRHEARSRLQEALDIIRRHEQVRLQRAKIPVKILKDWCIETPTKTIHFPEEVLANNVLPFIADVVSPVEEIGGGGLQ